MSYVTLLPCAVWDHRELDIAVFAMICKDEIFEFIDRAGSLGSK